MDRKVTDFCPSVHPGNAEFENAKTVCKVKILDGWMDRWTEIF